MASNQNSFQLLEINVTSAQDLAPVSKCMRTYALVWVHPERKLATKVDQHGHTNPQWNEKFVFRVDDTFLGAESSTVVIEIYAAAWLRDVQIGSVRVLINNLFPSLNNANSKMRYVALQIRRPSGRPQGILNLGVQLLDNTMRSMPLCTELSSCIGYKDVTEAKNTTQSLEEKTTKLRRTKSDLTEKTSAEAQKGKGGNKGGKSLVGSSMILSSLMQPHFKEENYKDHNNIDQGNGSVVCSDVGPSASVVAAAIAKGLIKSPRIITQHGNYDAESSVLEDWTESESVEGLKTKLDRWRTELPPIYDNDVRKIKEGNKRRKRHRRRRSDGGGMFTCFGNVFGCEISITCGGGNNKKNYNKVCNNASSVNSRSYLQ